MQLRAMGEMEIHSFAHAELPASPPQISDLPEDADKADMINWLGARLDGDTASATLEEASKRAEIEEMAAYLLGQSDISAEADDFVLMLILPIIFWCVLHNRVRCQMMRKACKKLKHSHSAQFCRC